MIKQTLLAVLFFTCSIVFSQEVSITSNLPASGVAGQAIDAQYTLTKGATMGSFAKFQLDLPAGFDAQSTEIKGGNFTFENNRVKIVWVSLPSDASFTFSFKLTPSASVSGNVNLAPQFFYLENSVKKEYDPAPSVISFGGSATVAATDNSNNTNSTPDAATTAPPATDNTSASGTDNPPAANTVVVASETPAATANNTALTEPAKTTAPATNTTPVATRPVAAKSNVVYHVQLAALTNKPNKSRFAEYGAVKIVEDAGLYKVLVGSFKTLEEARKYKAQLLAKGTVGCFVVAYENGVRIKI
jgi:cell division septation protein DedD